MTGLSRSIEKGVTCYEAEKPKSHLSCSWGGNRMFDGAKIESQADWPGAGAHDIESQHDWPGVGGAQGVETGPPKPRDKAYQFDQHAPAEKSPSSNYFGNISRDSPQPGNPPPTYFGKVPYSASVNHGPMGSTQWFLPNGMIDPCPVFE